jgi:polyribonucleotide nucleotidyltransferase
VLVTYGGSTVLATVVRADPRPGLDFFPMQVDYREKLSAGGKFPGGFRKREGAPNEKEVLTMRMIDRPIRPLFPEGFIEEVQIQCWVMSHDGENDTDVLAGTAASRRRWRSRIAPSRGRSRRCGWVGSSTMTTRSPM